MIGGGMASWWQGIASLELQILQDWAMVIMGIMMGFCDWFCGFGKAKQKKDMPKFHPQISQIRRSCSFPQNRVVWTESHQIQPGKHKTQNVLSLCKNLAPMKPSFAFCHLFYCLKNLPTCAPISCRRSGPRSQHLGLGRSGLPSKVGYWAQCHG